ncbi:hypothetical protein BaRGS_00020127 [Batillaria attramentaria]|uniref:Uncharacterized protein n=1 Tax=Batillaria attramentaria TaxID=370345 RepID=A0ABD0KNJ7_9CAEN
MQTSTPSVLHADFAEASPVARSSLAATVPPPQSRTPADRPHRQSVVCFTVLAAKAGTERPTLSSKDRAHSENRPRLWTDDRLSEMQTSLTVLWARQSD